MGSAKAWKRLGIALMPVMARGLQSSRGRLCTPRRWPAHVPDGERFHRGPGGPAKDPNYQDAKKNTAGRSTMNQKQLRRAVGR